MGELAPSGLDQRCRICRQALLDIGNIGVLEGLPSLFNSAGVSEDGGLIPGCNDRVVVLCRVLRLVVHACVVAFAAVESICVHPTVFHHD